MLALIDTRDAFPRLREEIGAMEERLRRQLTTRIYGAAAFITVVLGILNYVMG